MRFGWRKKTFLRVAGGRRPLNKFTGRPRPRWWRVTVVPILSLILLGVVVVFMVGVIKIKRVSRFRLMLIGLFIMKIRFMLIIRKRWFAAVTVLIISLNFLAPLRLKRRRWGRLFLLVCGVGKLKLLMLLIVTQLLLRFRTWRTKPLSLLLILFASRNPRFFRCSRSFLPSLSGPFKKPRWRRFSVQEIFWRLN